MAKRRTTRPIMLCLAVTPEIRQTLGDVAKAEERTMTAIVERAVRDYAAAHMAMQQKAAE